MFALRTASLLSLVIYLAIVMGHVTGGAEPAQTKFHVPSHDAPEFISLFDGQTLQGWKAADLSWWSVEGGAITAKSTEEKLCEKNQYLFCDVGEMKNFELKLVHRIITTEKVNCGFQFRSEHYQDDDCKGYQVDNNTDTPWLVRLYDEFGRHTLAWRGQRTIFDLSGKRTESPIHADLQNPNAEDTSQSPPHFDLHRWHEYHLICQGERLTLKVNGQLVAEVIDQDPQQHDLTGLLALQLHSGPVMTVQFRDIRYKILPADSKIP